MPRIDKEKTKGAPKRIRRGFAQIIIEKVANKYDKSVDAGKLQDGLDAIERVIMNLDELKKAKRNNFRALKKFSKEEIEAYLATLK